MKLFILMRLTCVAVVKLYAMHTFMALAAVLALAAMHSFPPVAVAAADFLVYSGSNFKACMMDSARASPLTVVWPADSEYVQAAM